MAEAVRIASLVRACMEVLRDAGEPLRKAEVLQRTAARMTFTPYELEIPRPGETRWENSLAWQIEDMATVGWISKRGGRWEITDAGGAALARYDENQLLTDAGRLPGGGPPAVAEVIEAADAGDPRAGGAVDAAAHWLGVGLRPIFLLFNPEMVVLGGLLTVRTVKELRKQSLTQRRHTTKVDGQKYIGELALAARKDNGDRLERIRRQLRDRYQARAKEHQESLATALATAKADAKRSDAERTQRIADVEAELARLVKLRRIVDRAFT